MTAFKLSIGERNEKKQGDRAAPHEERRARHFAALRDWPRNHVRSQGCNLDVIGRSAGHSQQVVTGFKSTIGVRHEKTRIPRVVLTGAPRKAGERLGDELFNLDEKTKAAAPQRHGLRAPCKKRRERSSGAVQPVTSKEPT